MKLQFDAIDPGWLAAQRREHASRARPARMLGVASAACAVAFAAGWRGGALAADVALPVLTVACTAAVTSAVLLRRAARTLAGRVSAEQQRMHRFRDAQRRELGRLQADASARRPGAAGDPRRRADDPAAAWLVSQWCPVTLPVTIDRIDVAGGTLAGWSALLTTIAAPWLATGSEVTVIDMTGGGVAGDLGGLASSLGIKPRLFILPADLPRLRLGADLDAEALADVLALTAAAADWPANSPADAGGTGDVAVDAALLSRILGALGGRPTVGRLLEGLRAVGQIGGPRHRLESAKLTLDDLGELSALTGRGAEKLVIDRAWALEARLRVLAALGTAPAPAALAGAAASLTVVSVDRSGPRVSSRVLAAFLAVALTAELRTAVPGARRWQRALCILGAERLSSDVLDRLTETAETAGTGLMLAYRSIGPHVRERIGRGNAATAFMRLGNAEDAKLAAEQIGSEHKFVLSQLTTTVGASVTETSGSSYTGTSGTTDSVADSWSQTATAGRSRHATAGGPVAAATSASRDASVSTATSDSGSITAGISASTSWGLSTARALGTSDSLTLAAHRSRELVVEAAELQQLPQSAVLVSYPTPAGSRVALADANPAIMTLPTATLAGPRPGP